MLRTFATVFVVTEVGRLRNIENQFGLLLPIHRWRLGELLIGPAVVFQPTCFMFPLRIVMRPVDLTTLFVPQVLAIEAYAITRLQRVDPRCDVDIVQNEDSLA